MLLIATNQSTTSKLKRLQNLKWPLTVIVGCLFVILVGSLNLNTVSGQKQETKATNYDRQLHHQQKQSTQRRDYYYTRTRRDPNHLRISEEFKNNYVNDIKYESRVNGTKYEYYKSSLPPTSYDELVFETIDKMFRHRLSPFYLHHYDNEEDKRRASDPNKVSQEACARDLLYLVDKIPTKRSHSQQQDYNEHFYNNDEDQSLTPELTAFFDSYARQEAGLLMGNTFWVGAYDQCVNRHIFELINNVNRRGEHVRHQEQLGSTSMDGMSPATSDGDNRDQKVVSFKGQYCVASLKAPLWDKLIEIKKKTAKNYFKTAKQVNEYPNLFRLQLGICLPDSCDSTALERHSDEIKLLTTSMLESRYNEYELIDLYCLPDESSPLRQWSGAARNFVILVSIWMVCILLATIADVCEFVDIKSPQAQADKIKGKKTKVRRTVQLVSWFSLRANYTKLMQVSSSDENKPSQEKPTEVKPEDKSESSATAPNASTEKATPNNSNSQDHLDVNLRFLNAFKVMIMFWIVNGHIMLLMIQTAKNILYSDALLNELMHFLIGATFGVDLFFTMTGFLTAYLIFNSGHAYKMRITTWLYLSFHRYWRLAPMYLLAFWFSRSVMQMLGSGPLWDYGTSALTFRGLCTSESWWFPFTLTSNLHGLFEECMITSWYISCDMQFWLVSPIFIHLLAKHPSSGWLAAIATIIASSKVRYDAILSDKSARYDELVQPRADIFMRVSHDLPALYTHPHYRIAAYLVGLLAGHYVYMVKSRQWKSLMSFDLWQRQRQEQADKSQDASIDTDGAATSAVATAATSSAADGALEVKQQLPNEKESKPRELLGTKNGDGVKPTATKTLSAQMEASKRWRNCVAYSGLFMFLTMSFASFLLSHYYPSSLLKHAKAVAASAYAVDHLFMSVGASMVMIAMCFGQWPSVVKFLSHPNWTRLSKINYALLLLQCEAIYYQIFRYEQVPMAGTRELINILFNLLATLYPVAFAVTLVFEFPLANIEKLLLG